MKLSHISVDSSVLVSVGYDNSTRILEIIFQNGHIYKYFGVPEYRHKDLMQAESHGKYFNKYIKDKYKCQKIK